MVRRISWMRIRDRLGNWVAWLRSSREVCSLARPPLSRGVLFWDAGEMVRHKIQTLDNEEAMWSRFMHALTPDDVVWDIGANFGMYSLPASRLARTVVAVEPIRAFRRLLDRNLIINRATNIISIPLALGARSGRIKMAYKDLAGSGMASGLEPYQGALDVELRTETVSVVTGSALLRSELAPPPTVMKIDVEGAEGDLLLGFDDVLRWSSLRLIQVEVHPRFSGDPQGSVERLLESHGWSCSTYAMRGQEYWCIARRQ